MSAPSASPDPSVPNPPSAPSIPSALSARIDAGALAHNIAAIAARIAPCRLMCIVKADAYGHGLGAVVPAALAAGIREFGVATPAEALAVRALLAQAGAPEPGAGTRILCWLYDETADLAPLVAEGIEVGLPNPGSLARLEAAARTAGRPALAHVKLDTGLGRSGLTAAQLDALLPALAGAQGVRIVGAMTHFACADEVGHPANAEQLAAFGAGVESLRGLLRAHPERGSADELLVHCANSPAALSMAPVPGDLARVGLSIYGLSPFADRTGAELGLRPAMELRSSVLTVKDVPAGHGASYGLLYRAPRDTRFALIAGGYADGIPRAASGSAQVTIRGRRFPVVGRIAMDQMIADTGPADAPDALPIAPGDTVIVMGDGTTGPSAEEWGAWSGSINYEIVTRVGPRADRVTVGRPPEDPAAPAPAAVQAAPASAELAIADLDAMGRFGKRLAGLLRAGDVLILTGDLGAGKTTLTQSIAAGLGVRGRVSSPTFVIAREHAPTGAGPGLVHVDAYRLGSAAELDDLGLEDALADSAAVIEWGAGLAEQLSAERLEVSISADPATEDRTIALTPHGTWGERLRAAGLGAADREQRGPRRGRAGGPAVIITALDTSGAASAAVLDGEAVLAERTDYAARRHAESLGPALRELAALAPAPDAVVVGVGPGPFTGLRAGIAAGIGFGLGAGAPVSGVASHAALALRWYAAHPGGHELVVATDARRREVYATRFAGLDAAGVPIATAGPEVWAPAALAERLAAAPGEEPVRLGRGFALYAAALGAPVSDDPALLEPSAADLGRVAARLLAAGRPLLDPVPLYLREPDAAPLRRP